MEDIIELGIEGADKVVDKHFHKLPNKSFQSETYNPREIRKRRHRRRRRSPSSSESDIEDRNMSQTTTPQYTTYVPYSQKPPSLRPEYNPSPPPIGQPYFPPPPRSQGRRYEDADSDDDEYESDRRSRRPKAITRRSSSYHGPRGNDEYYNERQLVQRNGRGSSHDGTDRDGEHHNFKEEAGKHFTKSPVGITGAVGGALVGGWVARKAQAANRSKNHESNSLITLLGAAVGGLAVNAVVEKLEDRKKETAEKERDWEEKWGSDSEEDDRRERRSSGHRRRRRSRSYSNDRYD